MCSKQLLKIMKELLEIVAAFKQVENCGKVAALATVVKVRGSTYRRPGARMLITQGGRTLGTISGGCLENDVCERAGQIMISGEPTLVNYDTTSEEDIVWGLGLGCNGVVQVLIERLTLASTHLTFITECLRHHQQGVLATVFSIEGQVQSKLGAHLILHSDQTVTSEIADPNLTTAISNDAHLALNDGHSYFKSYHLPTGSVEVFIEVIQPPTSLIIFGTGFDVIPVVGFAKQLGWHVTVVDSRQSDTTPDKFNTADNVILTRPEVALNNVVVDERTVAVVMTHNYLHDLELLKQLLLAPKRYLGILGPKSRTERLLQDLRTQGIVFTEAQMRQLYSPVGLDIGADNPEEIALAIIAELQAVLTNRSGGFLRERKGAIHYPIDGKETNTELYDKHYIGA